MPRVKIDIKKKKRNANRNIKKIKKDSQIPRPLLPSKAAVDALIKQRLQDEQEPAHTRVERRVAQALNDMSGQRTTTPYTFVAQPIMSAIYPAAGANFLREAYRQKMLPGPDPSKARVPTINGVYHVPLPDSLPIGARVVVPMNDVFSIQLKPGEPQTFQRVSQG